MDYVDPDRFIKDWVAALRGSDYPQTTGKLHRPEGFCCLGVACDLYAQGSGEEYWIPAEEYYYFQDPDNHDREEDSLPASLVRFLELTHDDEGENPQELPIPMHIAQYHAPEYIRDGNKNPNTIYITSLNDEGCPFPVIADIIEDWWKERKETA